MKLLWSLQLLAVFLTAHFEQYQTMDGDAVALFLMLMWRPPCTATGEYLRNDCLVIRLPKLQSIRICVFSFNFDNHKKFSDAQADSELRPEQQVSSTLSEAYNRTCTTSININNELYTVKPPNKGRIKTIGVHNRTCTTSNVCV